VDSKKFKHLPLHEPDDWLWKNIESQLNTDDAERVKLHVALSKLPQYEPPIQVWSNVEKDLQLADNEAVKLRNALHNLKRYEPSTSVWVNVNNTLKEAEAEDAKLKNALQKLQQYEPPAATWMKIMQDLPEPQRRRIVQMFPKIRLQMAASVLGVMFAIGAYFYVTKTPPDGISEVVYSQEMIDDEVLKANAAINIEDENAFAMVDEICTQHAFVCEQPEVKNLKSTLDELNMAHAELKDAIGNYGTDSDLQQKLQAIDMERTEILKKIMTYI
jgi:hypothetical protein